MITQILIASMGFIAVGLAIRFIIFFRRSTKPLSYAMQAFLWEQTVSASCTLIFASSSLYAAVTGLPEETWNRIPPNIADLLRTLMFGVMIYSTTKLSNEVRRIIDEED